MSSTPAVVTDVVSDVVSDVLGRLDDGSYAGDVDLLELTSEERASAHFTAFTIGGRRMRVSLPRGVELQDGDVLFRNAELTVAVRAAAEDLLWLRPGANQMEWWAACYQLGNLHRPARFLHDGVLTPRDPMVLQILSGLDVQLAEVRQPFVGRRFGAAGAHHHADREPAPPRPAAQAPETHAHTHDHDHDHHDHPHPHDHAHG